MMTSSNRKIFHVIGPLWGESTGHRWIPLTKASDAELDVFFERLNKRLNNRDAGDLRRHRAHYDVIVTDKSSLHMVFYYKNQSKMELTKALKKVLLNFPTESNAY